MADGTTAAKEVTQLHQNTDQPLFADRQHSGLPVDLGHRQGGSGIQTVGHGRKELSPELLSGFAAVLSFRVEDLAALVDIELTQASLPADTATRQVAELIWDVRHLSSDQLRAIQEQFGMAP